MFKTYRFDSETLPVHAGRYRLVVSPLCPFCRRLTIARRILGLQNVIAITYASGVGEDGFEFLSPGKSFNLEIRARSNRELYRRQAGWQDGDPTSVPVIIDEKQGGIIVNNESEEILIDLCTVFKPFWEWGSPDLYPAEKRAEIDALDLWLKTNINGPTGKVIHGTTDPELLEKYHRSLWQVDRMLTQTDAFLFGEEPYESDIRLYVSLQSLLTKKPDFLEEYPHLQQYFRTLTHRPGWVSQQENLALNLGLENALPDGASGLADAQIASPASACGI